MHGKLGVGSIMGSQNIMGSDYESNISDVQKISWSTALIQKLAQTADMNTCQKAQNLDRTLLKLDRGLYHLLEKTSWNQRHTVTVSQ